jgi:two-component system, chemotaxis family, response regulator PixH
MKSILVVDDMQSELELLRQYLAQAGYSVTTANDGQAALNQVAQQKPDVIVTDLMMPDMGGLELCRALKKDPSTADIPVIACSVKSRDVDRMWATKQGVITYLVKPCTKEELVEAVQAIVG